MKRRQSFQIRLNFNPTPTKVFQVLPDSPLLKTVSESDEDIEVYFTHVKGADSYVLAMFDQRMNPVTGINAFGILPSSHSGHVSFRKDQLVSGEVYKIAIGATNQGGTSVPRIVDFKMPPEKVLITNIASISGNLYLEWAPSLGTERYEVKIYLVRGEETHKDTFYLTYRGWGVVFCA